MNMLRLPIFYTQFLLSSAAPIVHDTVVGWKNEPSTRGTTGILFSCTTTLGLCVWTALHLNIEPVAKVKMTLASRFLAKAIWAFTALIAPELVLSIALHQFLVACKYRSIVNNSCSEKNGNNIGLKKAFYAVMGGFAFKMTDSDTVTLGVEMLVKEGAMEKIRRYPTAAIDDKSKADYLAKVLACFQSSWILLQCLGRKINHLPITLLELNTVVHVLNAVIMYGLWWEKPVDVCESSIIDQFNEESEKKTVFVGVDVLQKSLHTVASQILPGLRSELHSASNLVVAMEIATELDNTLEFVAKEIARFDRDQPGDFGAVGMQAVKAGVNAAGVVIDADALDDIDSDSFTDTLTEAFTVAFMATFTDTFTDDFTEVFGYTFTDTFSDAFSDAFCKAPMNISPYAFHESFRMAFGNSFRNTARDPFDTVVRSTDAFNGLFRGAASDAFRAAFRLAAFRDAFHADVIRASTFRNAAFRDTFRDAFRDAFREAAFRDPLCSTVRDAFREAARSADHRNALRSAAFHDAFRATSFRAAALHCAASTTDAAFDAAFDFAYGAAFTEAAFETAFSAAATGVAIEPASSMLRIVLEVLSLDCNSAYRDITLSAVVSARSSLFQIACDVIREQSYEISVSLRPRDGKFTASQKAKTIFNATREAMYEAKFQLLRQQAFDWAGSFVGNLEARDAAYKAAFHLNPRVAIETPIPETPTLGFMARLRSVCTGSLITNQIIRVPGLLGDLPEEELPDDGFNKEWCVRHRLILLGFSGCTGVFYGGMHSIKWDDPFPSPNEKSLWRLSSLVGVVGLFPIMAISFLNFARHRYQFVFLVFLGVVSAPLFVLARSYLIIESFVSMRALPERAYMTVNWAELIPHL